MWQISRENVNVAKFYWGSEFGRWSPSWWLRHGTFTAVAWIPISPKWEAERSSQKQRFTYNSEMVPQSSTSTIHASFPKGFTTTNSITIIQDPSNWTSTWACKGQFPYNTIWILNIFFVVAVYSHLCLLYVQYWKIK